jgi:hypothetical protein
MERALDTLGLLYSWHVVRLISSSLLSYDAGDVDVPRRASAAWRAEAVKGA